METFYKSLYVVQATLMHLFWKTWVYHWNVTGKDFQQLHILFGNQYEFMFEELDKLSEHMRYFDIKALGPLSIVQDTSVIDDVLVNTDDISMISNLLQNNQTLIDELKNLNREAEAVGQSQTGNLAQQMMEDHGKFVWMLRSTLK
jgi:starvation-inducible DNA-binding protein